MNDLRTNEVRLLMIEDSHPYTLIVERYITDIVDDIVVCESLESAEPLFHEHFDIVWFDLNLPDSTIEQSIAKMIECRGRNGDSVILVVSGFITPDIRVMCERGGADAVVDKHDVSTGIQIVSLILLGVMRARQRGMSGNGGLILERASRIIAERFPETVFNLASHRI